MAATRKFLHIFYFFKLFSNLRETVLMILGISIIAGSFLDAVSGTFLKLSKAEGEGSEIP